MSNQVLLLLSIATLFASGAPYIGCICGIVILCINLHRLKALHSYRLAKGKTIISIILSLLAIVISLCWSYLFTVRLMNQLEQKNTTEKQKESEPKKTTKKQVEEVIVEESSGRKTKGYPAEGLYYVGKEIKPGIYYKATGNTYFERLNNESGDIDSILANVALTGPSYVEILPTDVAFHTQGEGEWVYFDPKNHDHDIQTSFSDGMYLVGVDIEKGTYRALGKGSYELLSSVNGSVESIIKGGEVIEGIKIVITDEVFAVKSMNGVKWVKIDE